MQNAGRKFRLTLFAACTSAGALLSGAPAWAQETAAEDTSEEIVVTAQRREESLHDVPLAVSAVGAQELEERNYQSMEDFRGAVPSLQVGNYVGEARMNIRGIGNNSLSFGSESQVAFSINGVYMSRSAAAAAAFLDVERIEILRGPQGTLYGRNATGGAVNVITRRPTEEFEGSAEVTVGDYNQFGTELILSGPIIGDDVLGRIAIATNEHDGYSRNLFDGRDYDGSESFTGRGTLLFNLSDTLSLTVSGDYTESDGSYATHFLGKTPDFPGYPTLAGETLGGTTIPLGADGMALDPRLLNANTPPSNVQESFGVSADLNWDISPNLALRWISSYREKTLDLTTEFDGTSASFPSGVGTLDFLASEDASQWSQELQLLGENGPITWVAGLFYFHEEVDPAVFRFGNNFGTVNFPFVTDLSVGGAGQTDAYAAFADVTWDATDALSFTLGLRYSYEEREADIRLLIPAFFTDTTLSDSADFEDVSPKFSISYDWNEWVTTYFTASRGFKSGGYDLSAFPPVPFDPETVDAYEIGTKFRGDNWRAEIAAFHYAYDDLQVGQIVNNLPATVNAAQAEIDGFELSFDVDITDQLSIIGAASFLDAQFTEFNSFYETTLTVVDVSGNSLPYAPETQANIGVRYIQPLGGNMELTLFGEANYHDRIYHTEFNDPRVSQPETTTYNASIELGPTDGGWAFEIFGRNISDEVIISKSWISSNGFGAPINGQLGPPATYGARFRVAF